MTRSRRSAPPIPIHGSSFIIAANGFSDGPSQPLARYLCEHGARSVCTVTHPLLAGGPAEHRVETVHANSGRVSTSTRRLPNRPPLTYALDPFVPMRLPRAQAWFGFNCVATAQGLVRRTTNRVDRVIHWNVDFVPDRFGTGALTHLYDHLDKFCCRHADGRVELSTAALHGRVQRYDLHGGPAVEVIPMGAWTEQAPVASLSNLRDRRVIFLGSLVDRMGVETVIDAIEVLRERSTPVAADIVGGGELLQRLRERVQAKGLDDLVTFHGFIADFEDVLELLARASVALAPYDSDPSSFTRFADPGKLKAYLSAGLPILLTDVPPNAGELEDQAGAEIVAGNAEALATSIDRIVNDPAVWSTRHQSALQYSKRFDWTTLFDHSLPALGVSA